MNYYITVSDWPDWLMSDDYHGNDLPYDRSPLIIYNVRILTVQS